MRDMILVNYLPFGNGNVVFNKQKIIHIIDFYHLLKYHGKGFELSFENLVVFYREFKQIVNSLYKLQFSDSVEQKLRLISQYMDEFLNG